MKKIMNRIIVAMLLAALLISACAIPAFAMGTKTFVTTGKCYLRSGPGLSYNDILVIGKGKSFTAEDFDTDERGVKWYHGCYNGSWGWVSERNLSESGSSGSGSSSSASHKKYVKITGSCNIRSTPSLDGAKVGTSDVGAYFKCSDAAVDNRGVVWYKITYKGSAAWVSSKYATTTNSNGSGSGSTTPAATRKPIDYSKFKAAEYYVVVTASSLNLRSEPSTDSGVIAAYGNGAVLYALQTNGDWLHVLDKDKNRSGYVSARYTEVYEGAEETDDSEGEATDFIVNDPDSGTVATFAELQAACPAAKLINAPAGASNVTYSWTYLNDKDVTVAQIEFDQEGIHYVLRAARCKSVDAMIDIDGLDADPEIESGDMHVVTSKDGASAIAHFFIADNATQYSLSGPAAGSGMLVKSMAETLMASAGTTEKEPTMFTFNS